LFKLIEMVENKTENNFRERAASKLATNRQLAGDYNIGYQEAPPEA
jgi:hypothetical protein